MGNPRPASCNGDAADNNRLILICIVLGYHRIEISPTTYTSGCLTSPGMVYSIDGTASPDYWQGHTQCVRLDRGHLLSLPKLPITAAQISPLVSAQDGTAHCGSTFGHLLRPCEWDEAGIVSFVAYVEASIQAEVHHDAGPHRIVLRGFSQGAALSFLVAVRITRELGMIN
jgi:hypothetical protein